MGCWENRRFVGAVIFGRGAARHIGRFADLSQTEICELVRVALGQHETPTSRILAIAMKELHRHCPGIKAVVAYADAEQGHVGTIYQATGWHYLGAVETTYIRLRGRIRHPRTVFSKYNTQSVQWLRQNVDPRAERVTKPAKHKYVWLFDQSLAGKIEAKPYPKREQRGRSETGDTPADHAGKAGSIPSRPLSTSGDKECPNDLS